MTSPGFFVFSNLTKIREDIKQLLFSLDTFWCLKEAVLPPLISAKLSLSVQQCLSSHVKGNNFKMNRPYQSIPIISVFQILFIKEPKSS